MESNLIYSYIYIFDLSVCLFVYNKLKRWNYWTNWAQILDSHMTPGKFMEIERKCRFNFFGLKSNINLHSIQEQGHWVSLKPLNLSSKILKLFWAIDITKNVISTYLWNITNIKVDIDFKIVDIYEG